MRIFHGGYEEYVDSLGGKALWSEMESLEAQRVLAEDELSSSSRTKRQKRDRKPNAPVVEEPEAPKVSKNSIARLKKRTVISRSGSGIYLTTLRSSLRRVRHT